MRRQPPGCFRYVRERMSRATIVAMRSRALCGGLLLLLLAALPARADAGVPMLFVTWPGMLLALIPVVAIEALIIRPRLKLAAGDAVRFTGIANLASTVVGIPLAWLTLVAVELVSTRGGTAFGLYTPWRKLLAVTV